MVSNIVYFFAGILTTVVFLSSNLFLKEKRDEKIKGKWSKIEKVEYTYDVDHVFKQELSAQTMLQIMNEIMKQKIETDCSNMNQVVVEPGDYSINTTVTIRMTKRDSAL